MNFDKFDLAFYRALLVTFFGIVFVPLLFEIGVSHPAYTVTAGTWLTGIGMCGLPAWIGYRLGRAAERASTVSGNACNVN